MNVLQVVGYKNAGKTTLVTELVRMFSGKGLRIGTIKHDAHDREPDTPGTDTWRHRQAGAEATVMVSGSRTMWIREKPADLSELITAFENQYLDLVIVEGFKTCPHPKLILIRDEQDNDLLGLPGIIGVVLRKQNAVAEKKASGAGIPVFHTDSYHFAPVLDFLEKRNML